MDRVVIGRTQGNRILQVRQPAVPHEPVDVMKFSPRRRSATSRAAGIRFTDGQTMLPVEQALLPSQIEHFARPTHHDRDDAGLCGHPSCRSRRNRLVDAVKTGFAETGEQTVEGQPHDEGGFRQRTHGVGTVRDMPEQRQQGIRRHIRAGARVS